ncbi:MAG: hypothetical protein IBJ00_00840 [Alphaproteobacteria bacterium]|nr:hypothetical protein [Alphaproteobacteria bacterium]
MMLRTFIRQLLFSFLIIAFNFYIKAWATAPEDEKFFNNVRSHTWEEKGKDRLEERENEEEPREIEIVNNLPPLVEDDDIPTEEFKLPNLALRALAHGELISMNHLAQELLLYTFKYLSSAELCSISATAKSFQRVSEDNTLWFPLYQKAKLVPFIDIQDTINTHVTSYKYLWGAIKVLQANLKKGLDPDYNLLLSYISQAFAGKIILYKLKSDICLLQKEPQKAQEYWNQFNLRRLTQAGYNSAVFFGEWGFEHISEDRRLNYLRIRERKGDKDAQRWVDQALIQGQLGQNERPLSERLAELKERIAAGDQNALMMLVSKIIQHKGLDRDYGSPEECFSDLEWFSQLGDLRARTAVVQAIYEGSFGQDARSEEERFQDLKQRASSGDELAQSYMIQAISQGELGQGVRTEDNRFAELLALDNDEACGFVLYALVKGKLGQNLRPAEERIKQIEELMLLQQKSKGRIRYSPNLIDIIFTGQGLGQEDRSVVQRFEHLEHLARAGIEEAEEKLIDAIYEGKLDQDNRPKGERFEDLKRRAQEGSVKATKKVIEALYSGKLAQKHRSADERFYELQYYADKGNLEAQKQCLRIIEIGGFTNQPYYNFMFYKSFLIDEVGSKLSNELLFSLKQDLANQDDEDALKWCNKALYEGTHGQDSYSPSERFIKLQDYAQKGDKDAEDWIVKALSSGALGQISEPYQERFMNLDVWARKGNLKAQQEIAKAISEGLLDQDLREAEERVNDLRELGCQDNSYAIDELVDLLISGRLEQYHLTPQRRFNEIKDLSKKGNKKAQQAIVELLTRGINAICYNEHGREYKTEFLDQDKRTENERFEDLTKLALAGNTLAREEVITAIKYGRLGQRKEDCFQNLLLWAALGDKQAQLFIVGGTTETGSLLSYSQNLNRLYNLLRLLLSP